MRGETRRRGRGQIDERVAISGEPLRGARKGRSRLTHPPHPCQRDTLVVGRFSGRLNTLRARQLPLSADGIVAGLQENRAAMKGAPPAFRVRPWAIRLENLVRVGVIRRGLVQELQGVFAVAAKL